MTPSAYFETTACRHCIIPIGQPLVLLLRWFHVHCPIMLWLKVVGSDPTHVLDRSIQVG